MSTHKSVIAGVDIMRLGSSLSAVRGYWPTTDLAKAQGAGIETLRPIFDLDMAMNADGSVNRTYMDGVLDIAARWLTLTRGTQVIFCPFNSPNKLNWSAWRETIAGNTTREVKFWINFCALLASRSSTLPLSRIWIEIKNEPKLRSGAWKSIQKTLYTTIRSKLPNVGVILNFGGDSNLADLLEYGDPDINDGSRIAWAFHQYLPWWILRNLAQEQGKVYSLDYDWPMDLDALRERYTALGDSVVTGWDIEIASRENLLQEAALNPFLIPVGETLGNLKFNVQWAKDARAEYVDEQLAWDAWGLRINHRMPDGLPVPFTKEGMRYTLQIARDWEIRTGQTLMMTEGGGGGWRYGSLTPEARASILRLQADETQVYEDLTWATHGWWMLNSLFREDIPLIRQLDAEMLASIV